VTTLRRPKGRVPSPPRLGPAVGALAVAATTTGWLWASPAGALPDAAEGAIAVQPATHAPADLVLTLLGNGSPPPSDPPSSDLPPPSDLPPLSNPPPPAGDEPVPAPGVGNPPAESQPSPASAPELAVAIREPAILVAAPASAGVSGPVPNGGHSAVAGTAFLAAAAGIVAAAAGRSGVRQRSRSPWRDGLPGIPLEEHPR